MAALSGPTPVTTGLVFHVNMYNSASWRGAPTTNRLPSPSTNGRFTTSNSWATYNTNQYNGGNYFSIGTISSVSSNIVTTSSNHPLRTFDVVTPQTTGGGVSAGTNYFVKKISNTQFSLHAYNGSQNGSQGYKNQSTGYHKVHDSIALNQQVSINATSFPTMWWGPPHQPNAGLVKEVVEGAGPEGQNVMRLHVHRTDGVADAMAYGVDTPVNSGDIINVSFLIRSNYPGKNLGYSTHFGGFSAFSGSATTTTNWVRVKFQWTASTTYNFISYWWPDASSDLPYWIDMCDLQIETNTGGAAATPFTLTSRSNTQALVDVTGNGTVTTNSLTYANDNTFSFNGSSDYVSATVAAMSTQYYTIEFWVYPTSFSNAPIVVCPQNAGIDQFIQFNTNGTFIFKMAVAADTGERSYTSTSACTINTYSHIVCVKDGSNIALYKDGVLTASSSADTLSSAGWGNTTWVIGQRGNSTYYFSGKLPILKGYTRALSASEVQQNFNADKRRFGL